VLRVECNETKGGRGVDSKTSAAHLGKYNRSIPDGAPSHSRVHSAVTVSLPMLSPCGRRLADNNFSLLVADRREHAVVCETRFPRHRASSPVQLL
jgi:hypothetical protein